MPKKVTNAKIAFLDFSLQKAKMKMGIQILVDDPSKLDAIRQRSEIYSLNSFEAELKQDCVYEFMSCNKDKVHI